jgi:hypothetical protein
MSIDKQWIHSIMWSVSQTGLSTSRALSGFGQTNMRFQIMKRRCKSVVSDEFNAMSSTSDAACKFPLKCKRRDVVSLVPYDQDLSAFVMLNSINVL